MRQILKLATCVRFLGHPRDVHPYWVDKLAGFICRLTNANLYSCTMAGVRGMQLEVAATLRLFPANVRRLRT